MTDKINHTHEELLTQLLNNIDDNIYFKDKNSRFILINHAFAERLNTEASDVIGKTDFDIFTEEHAQPAFDAEQLIIKTGIPLIGLEEKETWTNGKCTWSSTTKMPLKDARGNIVGTFGISRDITEHKLNEIKLHKYARKLTRINKQLENDLRMAANLQQAFLPQFYPSFTTPADEHKIQFFHRYIASTHVSGDLCSIQKLNETDVGMIVCDVMGHGVRSALITAIIHTMISDLSRQNLPPGQFISEMNQQLRPIFQSQDAFIFVTACYLILNTETGLLRGSSAGHTIPFIIHSNSQTSLLHAIEPVNGPALAVIEDHAYQTFEAQLEPGDAILMYTDGLLEETSEEDEEFGIKRAQKILAQQPDNHPEKLCNTLVYSLQDFHASDQFNDDLCLLAFRWNGPAE